MWELNIYLFEHCTLLEDFSNKKNECHFKSGLYSTFSNATIMNKDKQVSHSKQEIISIIFTHPYPNPSAPKDSVTNLTSPEIPKIIFSTGHKTLLITSSTFLNSGS